MPKPSPKVTGVFSCGHAYWLGNVESFLNKVLGREQERCVTCHAKQAKAWYWRKGRTMRMARRKSAEI